jgi:ribosome biogenesis protein BMS1
MSAADILGQSNKKHSNRSKNGKKGKKGPEAAGKRKNTKAFNVSNVVSAKKNIQRNLDKAQQKEVVPLVNREEAVPPPSLVVVMGPKSCGKTTLIRSLVKIYTGQNMTDTTGPVTVIAGNKKRFTFFECPLDLYSMTDLAKVPDLVLLMIDASYGLEMETFEYLNLLQLHGFPKVIGVLTHLDRFRSVKSLQNTKKEIKHRFWTEIYKGAKLFDFMGVVNGKYRKHEVKRLSLQINRVKFRPLVWHNTHPYLLVDRVEDVTPVTAGGAKRSGQSNETEEEDFQGKDESGEKEVTLYGYVRGCHLKSTTKIHLVGAGDFDMHSITALPDPCPLKSSDASQTALKQSRKKDHLLYAPMANVGRVSMDKDSLYIDLKHIHYTKKDQIYLPDQQQQAGVGEEDLGKGTPMDLLRSMQEVKMGVDQQLKRSKGELSLFSNSSSFPMEESDGENEEEEDEYDRDDSEEEDEGEDEDEEEDEDDEEDEEEYGDGESENDNVDEEDISENDETSDRDEKEGDDEDLEETDYPRTNHKTASETSKRLNSSLMMKQLLSSSSNRFNDVMKVVYGHSWAQSTTNKKENIFSDSLEKDEQDDDEDFFTLRSKTSRKDSSLISMNRIDSSRFCVRPSATNAADDSGASSSGLLGNWNSLSLSISEICQRNSRNYAKLKTRFVTGGYSKPLVARSSDDGNDGAGDDEDDEVYGDFEDLEALEKERGENNEKDDVSNKSDDDDSEEDEVDSEEEQERMNEEIDQQLRALNAQKKSMFKMKFDREYDHKKSVSFFSSLLK